MNLRTQSVTFFNMAACVFLLLCAPIIVFCYDELPGELAAGLESTNDYAERMGFNTGQFFNPFSNRDGEESSEILRGPVSSYTGDLSPNCVWNYYRTFVSKFVPPRNYQYYHETLLHDDSRMVGDEVRDVALKWRIVGGSQISITDAPYQVLYGKYCGGSLIAPEWVITAAHCKTKEKYVYTGNTRRSKTEPYKICAHFIHPLWQNSDNAHNQDFDYQLILLEEPIPVSDYARPIAIGSLDDVKPGALVSVSGWGHKKYRAEGMEDLLRRVYVPILPTNYCHSIQNANYKNMTERMFCAGLENGNKDSCQGDSGGPAVVNGKLVGLVSFGVGCALKDRPGVYSNLPVMRDWIRSITSLPL